LGRRFREGGLRRALPKAPTDGNRGKKRIGKRVGAGAGAVEHAAARLDVLLHLGDIPAHALKLADRTTERLALLDVAHRLFKGAFGETAEC